MKRFVRIRAGVAVFSGLLVALAVGLGAANARTEESHVQITVFWQQGCPYCAAARGELETLAKADPALSVVPLQIGVSAQTDALYGAAVALFALKQAAVPLVVIGNKPFLGYLDGGRSAALYRQAIDQCLAEPCPDVIGTLTGRSAPTAAGRAAVPAGPATPLPDVIELPIVGAVSVAGLSLPALTVLLAAIDGFNPCAMWVLVFLIGLLLGLENERRMWLLGGAFLGATAVMYFVVMAAWLNLILFIGAVVWVRAAIGVLAIGGGLFYLREYWTKPDAACRVVNPGRRQRIMAAFRDTVERRPLLLAIPGIMVLAVMVNFIELLCSAGIPAVYTQVLALNDLPTGAYYGYIALYIAVFMLDDVAIFATAMIALRVAGLTGAYARASHLIGGIVLLALGAVMLLLPDLLAFG
jgi:glutaredoxin